MEEVRILWIFRDGPIRKETEALAGLYLGKRVIVDIEESNLCGDAQALIRKFREGGYADLVVSSSFPLIEELCAAGIHPLISVAVAEGDPEKMDFHGCHGCGSRFTGFKRVKSVRIEAEELSPTPKH